PALWPVALVGFLARGGIVLFLLAVVTPPSPVGLANLVGPTAVTATGLNPIVVGPLVAIVVGCVVGVLLAVTLGAWADGSVALAVHHVDDRPGSITARVLASVVAVRILVAVPLVLVATLVVRSIVQVAYDQLVLPTDLSVPLAWRVAGGAAGPVAVIVIAWQVVEVVGGIAVRRVVLLDESVLAAIGMAVRHVVRHPVTATATAALGIVGLAIALVPAIVALGVSGAAASAQLAHGSLLTVVALVAALFVAVWLGGLAITAVGAAWRSVLWSVEVGRLPR
ncbi:MAG TPA: hypothetical protein VE817_02305, partial [Candidatus Acidoferrum sp.]|nr:hypothetical protein [Candidatus Acidoferrum sp.]